MADESGHPLTVAKGDLVAARLVKAALEKSVAPADAAWADEAGRRAARHDALLAAVAAREGP